MPQNGVAVRLVSKPPSAPTCTPDAAPAPTKIEVTIGEAVADAAETVAVAMTDFEAGGAMRPATRVASGERLGRVAELFLSAFGELPNFAATAHREGKRTLIARHAVVLRQHCGTIPEAAINELLDHVVAIASKVASDEMVLRAN